MKYPNFEEEKILWKQGFKCVVGLDEAGRGPLAGPVVAAAVNFKLKKLDLIKNLKFKIKNLGTIRDSKQLSEKKRQEIYEKLTNSDDVKWGIGIVSEKVIEIMDILNTYPFKSFDSFHRPILSSTLNRFGVYLQSYYRGEEKIALPSVVKKEERKLLN